jgi:hypothetical protein
MKMLLNSSLKFLGTAAIATTVAAVTAISAPSNASAVNFTFNNITGAGQDTVGDSLAQYLSMDVTASGTGVLFKFNFATNPSAFTNAFIGKVFIDDSASKLGSSIVNSGNVGSFVSFTGGLSNDNMPQGNTITKLVGNTITPDPFTTDYAFTRDNGGGNKWGVQEGESLGVLFANTNYDDVIKSINNGKLRVGYHVQGIGSGSDSYVNKKPVPVPGFLLGVMAAGVFGGSRLLKNKKQAAQSANL